MDPEPLIPRLPKVPRLGHAGPHASATPVRRRALPSRASADRIGADPREAQRIRCAAGLIALLATVALQASCSALAPGLTMRARGESLAVGFLAAAAALPVLHAACRRWPSGDAARVAADFVAFGTDRAAPASATALAAIAAWWLCERYGWRGATTLARSAADILGVVALYRAGVVLLDARRVGQGLSRYRWPLVAGLAPLLVLLSWTALGWLLEGVRR